MELRLLLYVGLTNLFCDALFIILFLQIAAGEAKNPRRNLPKAIKRVYIRKCKYSTVVLPFFTYIHFVGILLFYILGTLVIGLLVPSNSPFLNLSGTAGTAAASPFVIAIERARIKALPSVNTSCLRTWVVSNRVHR